MKNYYILTFVAFIVVTKLWAQSLPNEDGPPERPVTNPGEPVAAFLGISVSILLRKVLSRKKAKALPEAPAAD